jgi:alanine racemase
VNRVPVALQRRSGTFRPLTLQTLPVAVTANVVKRGPRSTIMAVVKADGYDPAPPRSPKLADVAKGRGNHGHCAGGVSGSDMSAICRAA